MRISFSGAVAERIGARLVAGLVLVSCAAGPDAGGGDGGSDAGTGAPKLGLNDVSILYPIPPRTDAPGYLKPSDDGGLGPLLPREVFDAIPGFPVVSADALSFPRMRVVAIRFDGCGGARGACVKMVRLVMQPIDNGGVSRDSALHLFYRFTDETMAAVVDELRRMQALGPDSVAAPLDVQPALVEQGVEGAYGTALKELVLKYAGEQNLFKVTFFLRAPPANEVWFMGGLDIDGTEYTAMDIVGVGKANQQVLRAEVQGGYEFTFNPDPTEPEDGSKFLTSARAAAASEEERRATMASYLRVENPDVHPVDDLSCAGCHVATFITAEARKAFGFKDSDFPDDVFRSTLDLTVKGTAATTPSSLRAFGYFREFPMIAQRTVNESAAVIAYLEAAYPAK